MVACDLVSSLSAADALQYLVCSPLLLTQPQCTGTEHRGSAMSSRFPPTLQRKAKRSVTMPGYCGDLDLKHVMQSQKPRQSPNIPV